MSWQRSRWLASVSVLILGCLAIAQTDTKPPSGQPPVQPKDGPPPMLPDPTLPSPRLKEAMDKGKTGVAAHMPQITLRGRVVVKDRPQTAMIEVDGKLYMVGKGSALTAPGNTILKVVELTRSEVRIEVSPLNETITLR